MTELKEPKFADVLPYVLFCVGLAFNLAYAFAATFWNVMLFAFGLVFLALLVPYLVLLVTAAVRARRQPRLFAVAAFSVACTALVHVYDAEWFRAPTVLKAVLIDDLNRLDLIVRDDGSCTTHWVGMFGVSGSFDGRCEVTGDTLLFHERPYDNDFIPDTALIVGDRIALRTTAEGEPDFSFATFFDITYQR